VPVARSSPRVAGRAASGSLFEAAAERRVRANDVRRVLGEARPLHGNRVVVFLALGNGGSAFVAGRRVGGAVERNRARRILRAAWREVAPQVGDGYDIVLVARSGIRGSKTQDLVAEMTELLRGRTRP
jgi:ribonuclease P protein component